MFDALLLLLLLQGWICFRCLETILSYHGTNFNFTSTSLHREECFATKVVFLLGQEKKGISCFRWWTDLILKMATPPGTHYSTFHFPHSFISIIRCSWRLQLRLCLCQLQLSLLARNVQLCSIAASFSFYCQTKPWSKVKAISSQKIVN